MTTLAEFLLARITEDEAVAKAAHVWLRTAERWQAISGGVMTADGQTFASYLGDDVAPHIARWDPARVLAECEAKRRIVERERTSLDESPGASVALGDVLCLLALPYADHPDYDESWRP